MTTDEILRDPSPCLTYTGKDLLELWTWLRTTYPDVERAPWWPLRTRADMVRAQRVPITMRDERLAYIIAESLGRVWMMYLKTQE